MNDSDLDFLAQTMFPIPTNRAAEPDPTVRQAGSRLERACNSAMREVGYTDHIRSGQDMPFARTPKPAASLQEISLLRDLAPELNPEVDGRIYLPGGEDAAKMTTLSSRLIDASVVARAGAEIIFVAEAPDPAVPEAPAGALYRRNARYDVIRPASFAVLADGAEVTESAFPISRASVDLSTMDTWSFRVSMTRAQQREFGLGLLSAELEHSIMLGIARACDKALIGALEAATLTPFSLGAAAAAGCNFADLRGIVGSSGTGATANLGDLYTAGISAAFQQDATDTVIGSFGRAAVAVHERITLLVERRSVEGDMTLTAHCNIQALLPDPEFFFSVSA